MAEGSAASRYVKLRKEQAPVEDITPGELNQPIDVPQVDNLSLSLSLSAFSRTHVSLELRSVIPSDLYRNRNSFRYDITC